MVFDKRIEKSKIFLHYGLGCDIRIESKDKETASKVAEETAMNFLFLITFLDRAFFGEPICILSYRYPVKGSVLEEFSAQILDANYLPLETSLRLINIPDLEKMINQMKLTPPGIRAKIDYSLFWFWKAVGARNPMDKFINLWIALEFLEDSLKDKYGLSKNKTADASCIFCKKVGQICSNCKKELKYNTNTGNTGIKTLEKKIADLKIKYDELASNRGILMHGKGHLDKNVLVDSINSIELIIYHAVSELLDNNSWSIQRMICLPMRILANPHHLSFVGKVKLANVPTLDECEKQPIIYGDYRHKFVINNDDTIEILTDVKHEIVTDKMISNELKKVVSFDSSLNIQKVWDREEKIKRKGKKRISKEELQEILDREGIPVDISSLPEDSEIDTDFKLPKNLNDSLDVKFTSKTFSKENPGIINRMNFGKLGRNGPCWCGSGKKYKKCHLK